MRLYNSLSRKIEDVVPVDGATVKIYSCGPTVYRYIHIGNMRSFMLGDLIRRALRFEGQPVRWVMNITDVGHMTDDVTEMIEIIERLIEKGHAYEEDGAVYYDVTSFPGYGKLSGNTLDALRGGHRQDLEVDPNKRHPADFALWKKAGPGRRMSWPSPWGEGFPGWHIECSAMSMKYLGERFDIHTGGIDLKFPHHEDEIAQSEGALRHQVVSIWVYGGFLQQSGQKMAKSAKNITRVSELAEAGIDPLAFRLLCFGTRYRSETDFSWDALEGTNQRLRRLRRLVADWSTDPRPADERSTQARELDRRFRDAVADDLNMPHALVVLEEAVGAGIPAGEKHDLLASWDRVLGLDLQRSAEGSELPPEVQELVDERDRARAARDFDRSDAIRTRLVEMGYEVMDTAEGTKVR